MNVNIQKTTTITDVLSDDDYSVRLKVDNPECESDYPYELTINDDSCLILKESDLTKLTKIFAKAKKLYKAACVELNA